MESVSYLGWPALEPVLVRSSSQRRRVENVLVHRIGFGGDLGQTRFCRGVGPTAETTPAHQVPTALSTPSFAGVGDVAPTARPT